MTRRDTIIIATLVNMVLLATLFITASREEEAPSAHIAHEVSQGGEPGEEKILALRDEEDLSDVDEALKEVFQESLAEGKSISTENPLAITEDGIDKELLLMAREESKISTPLPPPSSKTDSRSTTQSSQPNPNTLEIKVKRGDALEKIARQYGTTVKELTELNQLKTDSLKIGQTLRVPSNGKKIVATNDLPQTKEASGEKWVTLKSGDSAWKIAKQNSVSYEEVLRLNNLNEEKAKSLKVGDKIRIK